MASQASCTFWTDKEVKTLLGIWGESKIQEQLDGAVRNKTVYATISKKMIEKGCKKSLIQCRTKIKNLKKEYRNVKDHNGETGRGRRTCKHYEMLDSILGHRPASVPFALLDSGLEEPAELNTNGMMLTH